VTEIEIEKLLAAKEIWEKYREDKGPIMPWPRWLDSEIARLQDPHAEAKAVVKSWEKVGSNEHSPRTIVFSYVRHLESELAITRRALDLGVWHDPSPLSTPERWIKAAREEAVSNG